MDQKLDFIYNYENTYENNARNRNESFNDCLCDPFTSLDIIYEDTIEEIVSIATDKIIPKVQGKCLLRLQDGTELTGSWQTGRRNGQGSVSGPFLERFGVEKLSGCYRDGALCGIGRIHIKDGSIREGWFSEGKADGPFKGVVKVGC